MRPDQIFRLAVVQRSRYIGLVVMAGTRLIAFRSLRIPPRERSRINAAVVRFGADRAVDELVLEKRKGGGCGVPAVRDLPWPRRRLSVEAAAVLLGGEHRKFGQAAVLAEVARRCPALRGLRRRNRDRLVVLLSAALALTAAVQAIRMTEKKQGETLKSNKIT